LSVEGGHEKCAELLLEAGSDINILTQVCTQYSLSTKILGHPGLWEGPYLLFSVCINSIFALLIFLKR